MKLIKKKVGKDLTFQKIIIMNGLIRSNSAIDLILWLSWTVCNECKGSSKSVKSFRKNSIFYTCVRVFSF